MKSNDVLKVLLMLCVVVAAVALYLYARVDLGMSQEQINSAVQENTDSISTLAIAVWSQIALAIVLAAGYRIKRHRANMVRGEQ